MRRGRLVDALSWAFCVLVLAALAFGLDPYRRLPLQHGYGPDLRAFFAATLDRARELEAKGSFRISPRERWHLAGNWQTPEQPESIRPLAAQRRAVIVLPVPSPEDLEVEMDLTLLSDDPLEVEYGINGLPAGRWSLPPGGSRVLARLPGSSLHRGDNTFYLYRLSRRADPTPWLALGEVEVRRTSGTGP